MSAEKKVVSLHGHPIPEAELLPEHYISVIYNRDLDSYKVYLGKETSNGEALIMAEIAADMVMDRIRGRA